MDIRLLDNEPVLPNLWPQSKCRSHWPIFYGPVILSYTWSLFDGWTSNFWIMSRCETAFYLKINVCHSDLYFTVKWFCLISRRLFDGWVSYFQIMRLCDPVLDLKKNIGPMCPIFHGPVILPYILKTYLMDESNTLGWSFSVTQPLTSL